MLIAIKLTLSGTNTCVSVTFTPEFENKETSLQFLFTKDEIKKSQILLQKYFFLLNLEKVIPVPFKGLNKILIPEPSYQFSRLLY